ncbi:MAG: flagellar assembly peptidoglycan hydrolase FlgJ [Betaproteobacteria bacterium]|nr:flagellar assembly peptidoglycan hydrolase FlgJ [Betaproteobacteria bacterium]
MTPDTDLSTRFALDVGSVEALKRQARSDPDKALRSAAAQFEALLMQMMLKSMREAADSTSSTDSQDTKTYKSMLDQQLTMAMAKRGVGLSDVMVRQLSRGAVAEANALEDASRAAADVTRALQQADAGGTLLDRVAHILRMRPGLHSAATPAVPLSPTSAAGAASNSDATTSGSAADTARDFVSRLWPHALEASRTTGVAPQFILGQAALESGWGRGEIRMADGASSHNLFGIKAGSGWQGATADVTTTEYVNGAPVKTVERFRAYGSYADAFKDYANLLAANPRYAHVLNERTDAAAFARGLQQAGYATDPAYADKLTRVITGTVMRLGLAG